MRSDPAPRHALLPHPTSIVGSVQALQVAVSHLGTDQLRLCYSLIGDLAQLKLPEPRPAVRADGIWRHTCFEAFIASSNGAEYWEFNFSPSGAWAAYHFRAYREGMAPLMKGSTPLTSMRIAGDTMDLEVTLDLSWLARSQPAVGLRAGFAAVIEDRAGVLAYWALAHSREKPDFHHADSFIAQLD